MNLSERCSGLIRILNSGAARCIYLKKTRPAGNELYAVKPLNYAREKLFNIGGMTGGAIATALKFAMLFDAERRIQARAGGRN
jgi:hypothetical protein